MLFVHAEKKNNTKHQGTGTRSQDPATTGVPTRHGQSDDSTRTAHDPREDDSDLIMLVDWSSSQILTMFGSRSNLLTQVCGPRFGLTVWFEEYWFLLDHNRLEPSQASEASKPSFGNENISQV